MQSLIMKTLKVLLFIFLAALALLFIFGIALMAGWPWWVGFFFLIGILGVILFVILIQKLLARKSEKNFIHQVIAEDESRIKSMDKGQQAGFLELQDRWKEAVSALRKSHLKKYGNPLYVLPWYMVIGESGSGKTTAIQGADLSSPFAEVSRVSGISGTRNCDWWFFEQAVLIDTAGRYAIPVDEGRDKDEWQKFLSLLVRFRKKEPLNGLVVTVAADQLLQQGVPSLEHAGKSIRRRIDELMRVLGAKFPVFIMVTKCDLIQGAVRFCDQLEEPSLHQAMGHLNAKLSVDMATFCKDSVDDIGERLKELRLLMLNQNRTKGKPADPSLLLFPQEFEKIESGLAAFMRGAFQENPYQETPILRGIYFSSGRQEGTPYSHFLSQLGLIGEKDVLPGTNRGLFLHDFFSKILPDDRKLFAPTQKTIQWSRLTRSLGLTAWVAVVIAVCGLLSFSFVKNLKTLRDVSQSFSTAPVLQADITTDTLIMERFKQAVVKIEAQNANWWVPRLGLYESNRVEAGLKQKYCQVFESGFLKNFDKQMSDRMTRFSAVTPPEVMGNHAMHLVRRINLLKARLQGQKMESLTALPAVAYSGDLMNTAVIDEITEQIGRHYLYYLTWRREDTLLNDELNHLQTWLKHILTLSGGNLNWLVDWVNNNSNLAGVRMEDFWKGLSSDPEEAVVPAGFTPRGRDAINGTIAEIESALFEPLAIGSRKLDFQIWYAKAYIGQWEAFARYFPNGPERLAGRDGWRQTGMELATDQGPYFQLMAQMAESLTPFRDQEKVPEWVDLVYRLRDTRIQAQALDAQGIARAGIIKQTTDRVKSTLSRLENQTEVASGDGLAFEERMEAAKAYKQFRDGLLALGAVVDSRKTAFKVASDIYGEDPETGESPFFLARQGEKKLRLILGKKNKATDLFWELIDGPIQFYHAYVIREAQCHLQSIWEKEVFLEVQYVSSGMDLNKLLMGNDGYAVKFVHGPAAPFIDRSREKGYFAKSIEGRALDFNTNFLTYLTRGESVAKPVVANYPVNIKAYPTDANVEAAVKPHATKLELQCGDERNQLINLHYPIRKTFNWSAQRCGDVVFKIEIGNLVLTTVYDGYLGFPRFLNDFKTGQRTFRPDDFPEQAAALKRMRVKEITAKYQLSGHQPVLRFLQASPGRIPQEIAPCWGN